MVIELKSEDQKAIDSAVKAIIGACKSTRVLSLRKTKWGLYRRVLSTEVEPHKLSSIRLPAIVQVNVSLINETILIKGK